MDDDPVFNRGELGPYLIEKKLGQGAMGGVYLGMHKVLEVNHAIKMIHSRLLGDKTLIERFLREARNTAKMKHMNIVQVVGADLVDGIYYLAMEFVEGKTLEQLMRHPGLQLHDAVRYIHMIANALQYAHSRGIIHRDIKPANIMINEEDVAKLMDFGLVRDIEQPGAEAEGGEQLTMAGFIMGTPQYMPIEQWNGEGVDARSDIYALGVTLYVAISGKLPFPGKTPRDIFRRVLTSEAIDVRTHNDEIDDQLAGIVHKAIAPEKDDRYQSAEEFALALEQWWDQHPYQGTSLFRAPVLEDNTRGVSVSGSNRAGTVATRAVLTHHSSMSDSSPSSFNAGGKRSKAPLFAVAGLVAILGLVLGGWLVFGGKGDANNTPDNPPPPPVFKISLGADKATEATPLAISSTEYSISGVGDATVNGKPYSFGSALKLKPGLNKLAVAPAAGGKPRNLFVLVDTAMPIVSVPALEARGDNVIPTTEAGFTLAGVVADKGCGLKTLKLKMKLDGVESDLVFDDEGKFEQPLPVLDEDLTIELQATDGAGNRSKALTFWVVPDRVTLRFADAFLPTGGWATARQFEVKGKLSKARGVTLMVDGVETPIDEDGSFHTNVTREPGAHEIPLVAIDWLGNKQETSVSVFVDLEGPKLTLSAPESVRLEELPGSVQVKINVDDPNGAELTVNGKPVNGKTVKLTQDTTLNVPLDKFGDVTISAEVTDPAGRSDRREITVKVLRVEYRLLDNNKQGYREFLRLIDDMVMVEVPGGEYTRGDSKNVLGDAKPQKIKVSTFLIAKYEVSNTQYAKFLSANQVGVADLALRGWLVKDKNERYTGLVPGGTTWVASSGLGDLPVVNVTWAGAQAYCKWADEASGDLPTEAQWEYAARGTDGRDYPWGNEFPGLDKANFGNNRDATVDVSKQEAGESPFGVRNMAGNVEEWCVDWYTEGSYTRKDQQVTDPAVIARPSGFDKRVVRGGSFMSPLAKVPKPSLDENESSNLQAYARARRLPETGSIELGFRPAAKPPAE